MSFARTQRVALSEALLSVPAGAPTLCAGWTAHDLAAHVWVRERQPTAALGIVTDRFAAATEQAMAEVKASRPYPELARALRETPRTPATLLGTTDDLANAVEFLVHTEDVRRPNRLPARLLARDFEEWLWKRLPLLGRGMFRKAATGLALERELDGSTVRVRPGATCVTIVGRPSEIVLFAFGRTADARVRLVGPDAEVAALRAGQTGP